MQQTKIVVASFIAALALCAMLALTAEATDKRIINREVCTPELRGRLSCDRCCFIHNGIAKGDIEDLKCTCRRKVDMHKFVGDILVERDGAFSKWEETTKPLTEEQVDKYYEALAELERD